MVSQSIIQKIETVPVPSNHLLGLVAKVFRVAVCLSSKYFELPSVYRHSLFRDYRSDIFGFRDPDQPPEPVTVSGDGRILPPLDHSEVIDFAVDKVIGYSSSEVACFHCLKSRHLHRPSADHQWLFRKAFSNHTLFLFLSSIFPPRLHFGR